MVDQPSTERTADDMVAEADTGATVFHAGTQRADGEITATGGRVLGVTALGDDIAEAQAKAYQAVERIDWPGGFCRPI